MKKNSTIQTLTNYKYEKIAIESFKNSLRLHLDSILLFNNESYPSSYQLSVLAIEEFAKCNWVEHFWFHNNVDFKADSETEQSWLKLLYIHPKKQRSFIRFDYSEFSPAFREFVEVGKLETKKQEATYVGIKKYKKTVDVISRINIPEKKIKKADSQQIISVFHQVLENYVIRLEAQDGLYDLEELDTLLLSNVKPILDSWKHKTKIIKKFKFIELD